MQLYTDINLGMIYMYHIYRYHANTRKKDIYRKKKKIKLCLIVTIHDIGLIMVCMLKSKINYMQLSTERKASIN